MKTPIDTSQSPAGRVEKRKWPAHFNIVLIILPIFAGLLAFNAMLNVQENLGMAEIAKSVLISLAVILVSYSINRFAIEWSTDLTASGMSVAGWFGAITILIVGFCLWLFSFAGWVLPDVRHLTLASYGQELSAHVSERISQNQKSVRVVPAVNGAAIEFSAKAECEFQSACISGRGSGPGPIWRVLNDKSERAKSIVEQLQTGQTKRETVIAELMKLIGKYQLVLDDNSFIKNEKRRALLEIDAQIDRSLSELDEVMPIGLIKAYALELSSNVEIPKQAEAGRAVTTLLSKHADAINAVLSTIDIEHSKKPSFPSKPGMSDTFSYIGHFLAIAGVIWVAEGIFPFALFLYTLWYLQRHQQLYSTATTRFGAGEPQSHNIGTNTSTGKRRSRRSSRHLNGGV